MHTCSILSYIIGDELYVYLTFKTLFTKSGEQRFELYYSIEDIFFASERSLRKGRAKMRYAAR